MREKPKHLAAKLKTIRQRLALSQTEMKERLGFKGQYGRISEYELGRRTPSVSTLLLYARAAGILLEELVDDELTLSV
ncbi:MAG TPA: helix-turn-helix transcriptional regulator [Pyrinomonadaceae bacterium]|nr:helix-turn-helix transcriptional regulator [Pyrinomonadaceae bacterium]